MKKFKDCALLFLIGISLLQCRMAVCFKNEQPTEEATTPKTGFFSGIKNFFRGSPTTTTTTPTPLTQLNTQSRPSLVVSQAPLMPIGPRPDTPLSSTYSGQAQQPPQWPQVGISTTTVRPHAPVMPQQALTQPSNLPTGSSAFHYHSPQQTPRQPPNTSPGSISNRPYIPSPYDLSYSGNNAATQQGSAKPSFGLAPLATSTTSTTTPKTALPQQPQQPNIGFDLRFGSSTTTTRRPTQEKDGIPVLPLPRRPSTAGQEEFPALPTPKSPVRTPDSALRPTSPSAWNTTPKPSLAPSSPTPHPSSRTGSQNGNRVSFVPARGTSTTARPDSSNSIATDDELREITENLYRKEINSQLGLIQVDIQGKTRSIDSGDQAPNPLLIVDERALQTPTIAKMRLLFNNYEPNTLVNEHVTANERKEENDFVDAVMATSVMRQAMLFLQSKGIVTADPKTHRDLIKELWFTQYSRGSGRIGSSGFEHVFVNEVKNGTLIGLHNWVYFYEEEKAGHLDYKGYMQQLDLGTKAKILKARFTHNGLNKPVNTLFIGSSPELELALYTVCHQLRPDRSCPVSLGNSRFAIQTYSWRYRGKSLIGSAYPDI